jgi:outer membrane biosynthesis protein TonB
MGFLSRLFGRVQEEPLARPEPRPPEPQPDPEPVAAEPSFEPEPTEPEAEPEREPEPEPAAETPGPPPEPEETLAERELERDSEPTPPGELSLTLDEAVAALRAAGSDGIRIGFLSREYLRAGEEERPGARRRLVALLTEQLRVRGLLAEDGRFELREEPTLADSRTGL